MYWMRPAGSLHGRDGQTPIIANGKAAGLYPGRPFADGVASIDLHRKPCGPLVEDAGPVPVLKGPLADYHPPVKAGTRE